MILDPLSASSEERKLLAALAQHPEGLRDSELAIKTVHRVASQKFLKLVRALRAQDWLEGPNDRLKITQAGFNALGTDYHSLPEGGPALLAAWVRELSATESKILGMLAAIYPERLPEDRIREESGCSATLLGVALRRLRKLDLIDGSRQARKASDALF